MVDPYRYFRGVLIDERGALQFEKNINDDYVKFLRLGEQCLERHVGILAYISNNGYLESPTLRGLREHLSGTFASIDIVDLHGDQDRRERAPDGSADENVFDIKRGVAIALLRRGALASGGNCSRIDVFGSRAAKYLRLNEMCLLAIDRQSFRPAGALCLFANQDEIVVGEYEAGISVTDLFPVGTTGVESGRDEILVAFTEQELRAKLQRFATEMGSVIEAEYSVEEAWGRHLFEHRASIVKEPSWHQRIRPVLMAPFDIRYCFFRKDLLKTNSWSAGQHLRNGGNIALMCMRQVVLDGSYMHVGVSRAIVNNRAFASQKGKVSYHPLLLDPEEPQLGDSRTLHRDLEPNVSAVAAELLRSDDGSDDAWTLLHLVIAETHSARYRSRYADCLRREFPRVFRPRSELLLQELVQLGADLVAMWLLEPGYRFASWNQANSPKVNPFVHEVTTFVDAGDREVRKAGEVNRRLAPSPKGSGYGRVYINDTARFEGVPEAVWRFQVGGYQVCEKWLKDRKGRTLSNDDIEHYQKIVVALSETIRIMAEIDKVIEAHGGWPGAFVKAAADKV
jgi:predicted helicase